MENNGTLEKIGYYGQQYGKIWTKLWYFTEKFYYYYDITQYQREKINVSPTLIDS